MMDRRNALIALRDAVRDGTLPEPIFHGSHAVRGHWAYTTPLTSKQRNQVFLAYNGSLDAAMALHEALFPRWMWGRDTEGAIWVARDMYHVVHGPDFEANHENTARAWLLAILEALIAQEGE